MRKIIGYDTKTERPGVPSFLETDLGGIKKDGTRLDSSDFKPVKPFDLPEGHWAGLTWDGNLEPFPIEEEEAWKMRTAFEAVKNSKGLQPENSVQTLRAAASMVGIDVGTFVRELKMYALDGESLADVFFRKNNGKK